MQENSSTIAICYLHQAGDEQNKIWFTREHLQLLYKGRLKVYPLNLIRRISFNHRKLMLLLVAGGITASLSMVAIIKLFYNPWLTLSLLTLGCLAAYKGYQGSWVLTIEEAKYHSDFFIKSITPNLKAFVRYANTFTGHKQQGVLYLPVPTEKWEKDKATGYIRIHEPARLYFGFELPEMNRNNSLIIPVNTLEDTVYISWRTEKESEQDIFPFLQPSSIISTESLHPIQR